MLSILVNFAAVVFLAYSNGANDNFKGVATLFGSGTTNYKRALIWATITTFAGSLTALFLSTQLVASFSGKGLIEGHILTAPTFITAVSLGTALTVYFATVTGFPISTTHALLGALVGVGIASGSAVHFEKLWEKFFTPLLLSPLLALGFTFLLYPIFKMSRRKLGVNEETCLCIEERDEPVEIAPDGTAYMKSTGCALTAEQIVFCQKKYFGTVAGISAQEFLNSLHYLTAGMVSFARGLNDTPKIVAVLMAANLMRIQDAILFVGVAIALGGILNAKKVAWTMSKKITPMNHGQGFTANLITALLVIFASYLGMPVSTTHVSCGALFGLGLVSGKANWQVSRNILLSWLVTLPAGALFSSLILILLK